MPHRAVKVAVSFLPPAFMIGLLGFMGNGIVENRNDNIEQHIEIRKEMFDADVVLRDRVAEVKGIVGVIEVKQESINTKQTLIDTKQDVIINYLKRIENK